jgi:O-antigen ligase
MLADRPLFGVGLGSFDLLITEYYPANLIKEHNPWYYENVVQAGIGQVPHGFYTAVGGELGLVGILLTGLLLTLSTRKAISLIRSSPTSQERRLSFFIFVGLVSTLFTAAFYGAGRDHIVWFYIFLPFILETVSNED